MLPILTDADVQDSISLQGFLSVNRGHLLIEYCLSVQAQVPNCSQKVGRNITSTFTQLLIGFVQLPKPSPPARRFACQSRYSDQGVSWTLHQMHIEFQSSIHRDCPSARQQKPESTCGLAL